MFILHVVRYYCVFVGVILCANDARRDGLLVLNCSQYFNRHCVVRVAIFVMEFVRGFAMATVVDGASAGQANINEANGSRFCLFSFNGVFERVAFRDVLSGLRRERDDVKFFGIVTSQKRVFFYEGLLVGGFMLVPRFVIRGLFAVNVRAQRCFYFCVGLYVVYGRFVLFFLFRRLFLCLLRLRFFTDDLLRGFGQGGINVYLRDDRLYAPSVVVGVRLVNHFVFRFRVDGLGFVFIVRCVSDVLGFRVLHVVRVSYFTYQGFRYSEKWLLGASVGRITQDVVVTRRQVIGESAVTYRFNYRFLNGRLLLLRATFIVRAGHVVFRQFALRRLRPFIRFNVRLFARGLAVREVRAVNVPRCGLVETIQRRGSFAILIVFGRADPRGACLYFK